MDNKLKPDEVKEMPAWLRHFLIHVVKRSAGSLIEWIDGMKEASRETRQIESSNGRVIR